MSGTLVCGIDGSGEHGGAVELAGALAARLGLRIVLVHVLEGPPGTTDSVGGRERLAGAKLALEWAARDLGEGAETRVAVGDCAQGLAQVAAEEGADLVVLGSRPAGLGGSKLRCRLARELEAATPIPVLLAPPSTRRRSDHRLAVLAETVTR
jgi:nucleotide-binding universal stress UspA family protein